MDQMSMNSIAKAAIEYCAAKQEFVTERARLASADSQTRKIILSRLQERAHKLESNLIALVTDTLSISNGCSETVMVSEG